MFHWTLPTISMSGQDASVLAPHFSISFPLYPVDKNADFWATVGKPKTLFFHCPYVDRRGKSPWGSCHRAWS